MYECMGVCMCLMNTHSLGLRMGRFGPKIVPKMMISVFKYLKPNPKPKPMGSISGCKPKPI